MKILIAEDNVVGRTVIMKILKPLGDLVSAEDGREAINYFRQALDEKSPFDLICLDVMMPELDGQEVLQLIREEEGRRKVQGLDGAKIIMTTALSDGKNVMEAFRHQCDGYVSKPYDKETILAELKKLDLIADDA